MSKTYFDLDIQGKKELREKMEDKRPEQFIYAKPVEETTTSSTTTETTTVAPAAE